MLEKIVSIKNIGRFRDCSPRGDVSFRKMTLLFAENGRGKTTLCAILRSLQSGRPEFISERKTLGTNGLASVQLRFGGNNITFGNDVWSTNHPDIAIFDSVFVHDNVYAGDYVDHDHKKNLYLVVVGTQGVQLARQIEELDDQIREANASIRVKKIAASRILPNGTTLEDYLEWQPIENIEIKIQQKTAEIKKRQRTLDKAVEIQSKGLLVKIKLPEFPSDVLSILSKHVADITADAELNVRRQIEAHNMGKQGESWLSEGMGYVANDKCPFCGQGVNGSELIAAYKSHFNAAYKSLKQEVAQLSQSIVSSIGESSLNATQRTIANNLVLIEFWKQFAQMTTPEFEFEDARTKYATLRDLCLELVQQKQQSPTEAVNPGQDFQDAFAGVTGLKQLVEAYNTSIDGCNALINDQKTATQHGAEIIVWKKELSELEAKKKRFEQDVVQACTEYQEALNAKTILERQKVAAKEHLDQYCEQILRTYEQSINTYLDQFSAGFRITNSRHLYTGGTPSCHYQIEINNTTVDLGDSRTQAGTHCFKTTLSSGDRSALALAFFLASMDQDGGIANKTIVLDDPFTSQDRFRRTCTQQLIWKLAESAKQVIVLSHDPHFLKLIWDNYPATNIKVLQMCRAGDSTVIGEWDIEAETQSTYLKNYAKLLGFYREGTGAPLDVARSIRPFIEGMLRVHFPARFQPNEWLGQFIDKIRNADDMDGLSHAKADLAEIDAINEYSKKYHHDQNPNADSELLSQDELRGYVKRTLRLVGGI